MVTRSYPPAGKRMVAWYLCLMVSIASLSAQRALRANLCASARTLPQSHKSKLARDFYAALRDDFNGGRKHGRRCFRSRSAPFPLRQISNEFELHNGPTMAQPFTVLPCTTA